MLQDTESIPADIVVSLSEKKIGFRLDNADLVKINTVFNYFVFNFFIHLKNKMTTFHFYFYFFVTAGVCAPKEIQLLVYCCSQFQRW